jgi:hypothetical protein
MSAPKFILLSERCNNEHPVPSLKKLVILHTVLLVSCQTDLSVSSHLMSEQKKTLVLDSNFGFQDI